MFSCTHENSTVTKPGETENPGGGELPGENPGENETPEIPDEIYVPEFDGSIREYNNEKADDADKDAVIAEDIIYYENQTFSSSRSVKIVWSESGAEVTASNNQIIIQKKEAYVTVDLLSNDVKPVEITVSGKCTDGQLKIYGKKAFKLIFDGLDLSSSKGPAINCQNKSIMYIHLNEGTVNHLADGESYSDDQYYINPDLAADEDRKGCLFSEGGMVFSGTGSLTVEGRNRHGIATDSYLHIRPGVTIAVTDAVKNAIHVKGKMTEERGIRIDGGLVYANTSSISGKAVKTDLDVDIRGGKLLLNTSGGSMFDEEDNGTASAAGIKADGNMIMSGGTLVSINTGDGGKGLNIGGTLQIDGGDVEIITSGKTYVDDIHNLTSAPKGVKAVGDITINRGKIRIIVGGENYEAEGLESESKLLINGGDTYVYAKDDAIKAAGYILIKGGSVFACSGVNDGIDTYGTLNLEGGNVISIGGSVSGKGFDCDKPEWFKITKGGTFFGIGGKASTPSEASNQRSVIYKGLVLTKDNSVRIADDTSGETIFTYTPPCTISKASLFFSSKDLVLGNYTIYEGDTAAGSFASLGMVTVVEQQTESGNNL